MTGSWSLVPDRGSTAVPSAPEAEPPYTRAIVVAAGGQEDGLGAALERVLDQRAGDRAAEPLAAHGGQRGDADDLGHGADRLMRPGGDRRRTGPRPRPSRSARAACRSRRKLEVRRVDGRVALGAALRPGAPCPARRSRRAATAQRGGERVVVGARTRSVTPDGGSGAPPARRGRAPAAAPRAPRGRSPDRAEQRRRRLVHPLERLRQRRARAGAPRAASTSATVNACVHAQPRPRVVRPRRPSPRTA